MVRNTGWRSDWSMRSDGLTIRWPEVRIPWGKNLWVFQSQKCCADSLSMCLPSVCISTQTIYHVRTLNIMKSITRVRWIAEARKDPACTRLKCQNNQPVDCGHYTEEDDCNPIQLLGLKLNYAAFKPSDFIPVTDRLMRIAKYYALWI